MAEAGIKGAALNVSLLPDDPHDHAVDPGGVLARQGRRRQQLFGGVGVHVMR